MGNICSNRKYQCNFKTASGSICGEVFSTQHRLNQHKNESGHKRSRAKAVKKDAEKRKSKKNSTATEFKVAKFISK